MYILYRTVKHKHVRSLRADDRELTRSERAIIDHKLILSGGTDDSVGCGFCEVSASFADGEIILNVCPQPPDCKLFGSCSRAVSGANVVSCCSIDWRIVLRTM